ncbi:MAG TPA: sigma-E factor negative regulatory protein [Thermomonas sp.]|nr:sigma-E factor negative regulatory protein [Thermomonas sp.]
MNANDIEAADMNPETVANDLTQLSSREQLSALMDGALPADQTRFLLRRLQHDAPLAECWERWRLTGEVMRGLAPAQRLPADFATRVGASLRGDAPVAAVARNTRTPGWLRWGGGAGMVAASLVVVALMARQPVAETPQPPAVVQVASAAGASSGTPATPAPVPGAQQPLDVAGAAQTLAAASVVAVAASRPSRNRDDARIAAPARLQPVAVPVQAVNDRAIAAIESPTTMPQPDIVTRPWPRSVLPQYASGALAVGFGGHAQGATAYNPFQAQAALGNLPPLAKPVDGVGAREPQAANIDPQREAQAQP